MQSTNSLGLPQSEPGRWSFLQRPSHDADDAGGDGMMDKLPDQIDMLAMLMAYEKQHGPISSRGIENLADYLAAEIRALLMEGEL
jgi:hypothetical protein